MSSNISALGSGTCGVVNLVTGPFKLEKQCSVIKDEISAPHPHNRGFSSTVMARPVSLIALLIDCRSNGTNDLKSITLALILCFSFNSIAAFFAL